MGNNNGTSKPKISSSNTPQSQIENRKYEITPFSRSNGEYSTQYLNGITEMRKRRPQQTIKPMSKNTVEKPTNSKKTGDTYPTRITLEYKTNHYYRGRAVILSHEFYGKQPFERRYGSLKDVNTIQNTLKELNFQQPFIDVYSNLNYKDIMVKMRRLSEENFEKMDCLMVFILTHGLGNGVIMASDRSYNLQDICKLFRPSNCKTLTGKPKIFFIQACQGNKIDYGSNMASGQVISGVQHGYLPTIPSISNEADFLIAYSTVEGYVSYRDPTKGSWFIQALCEELKTDCKQLLANKSHILDILTRVNYTIAYKKEIEDKRQCCSVVSTLTKNLYFK